MEGTPGLPFALLAVGAAAWLALTVIVGARLKGFGLFLYLALSARYITTFFHDYTTKSLAAGQSLNSFVTLALTLIVLFMMRRDLLRFRIYLPVYAFIAVLLLSGMWNMEIVGSVNALIRQFLFLGLMTLMVTALDSEMNDGRVSIGMLWAFATPLLYQGLSILFRLAKASESDGSVSYIGGYVHEGVFSILLLTGLVIASLAAGLSWRRRSVLLAVFFTALIFANYRTAVIAGAPILLVHFVFGSATRVRADLSTYVRSFALLGAVCGGLVIAALLSQRMADIGVVLTSGSGLFKPPTEFGADDRSLLSGRIMIWSDYLYTTLRSDLSNLVFGFGPDSWQERFTLYAHNVYISYIYEIGIVGIAAYVYMVSHFIVLAMRARRDKRWQLLAAHAAYLVLGLGTMPNFTIEGVILYAVICGYTAYYYLIVRVRTKFIMPVNRRGPKINLATASARRW